MFRRSRPGVKIDVGEDTVVFRCGVLFAGGALIGRKLCRFIRVVGVGERLCRLLVRCWVFFSTECKIVGVLQDGRVPALVRLSAVSRTSLEELVFWAESLCRFFKNVRARSLSV